MIVAKQHFWFLFSLFIIFGSCSKSLNSKDDNIVEELKLAEIYFEKDKNPSLSADLILKEDGGKFSATLPRYISKNLIPSFKTNAKKVLVKNTEQVSGVTVINFTQPVTYTLIGNNDTRKDVTVTLNWSDYTIPHIYIDIDGKKEVEDKENYLDAEISILGKGAYPDFLAKTQIRGRGNSTWSYPKKPYRLRLITKSSVLGLPDARNWVLLANYLDASLMCNTVAMKIGRDLKVPFTNDIIPVDLTINGTYRGSYVLTQHLEVADNRINVTENGYLFEMDTYYDEEFKFISKDYNLPVMIKFPDLKVQSDIIPIQTEFEQMENLIFANDFPDNGYRDKLDVEVAAKFILVNMLTANEELNHPKSTYMHKIPGGKFRFGPLWDFDWGYGYETNGRHFENAYQNFFWTGGKEGIGTRFFKRLLIDTEVQKAFKSNWEDYKSKHFNNLLRFIDEYAAMIRESKNKDEVVWKKGENFDQQVAKLKSYLNNRRTYIDNYINNGF